MTDTTATESGSTMFSDIIDGGMASVGMKDVVMDNAAKRVGAAVLPFAGGMFVQGALTRSALSKMDKESANKVVDAIPGGAVTVRRL